MSVLAVVVVVVIDKQSSYNYIYSNDDVNDENAFL